MTQTIRNCENTRKTDSRQQGLEGLAVQICIDGTWLDVPAAALIDPCQVEQLAARCRAASSDPEFDIPDLLSLPDEARLVLLKLINDLRRPYAIRVSDGEQTFDNVFTVALYCAVDSDDIDRSSRSQQLAVEAAALMYPNSLELACQRIGARFHELGVRGLRANQLERRARRILTETAAAAGSGETGLLARIAFRNGTVDRASLLNANGADAELLPYDAGNVSEGALSYDYRPEADCPLWLATLDEIFPRQGNDDHRIDVLQEFMGYSLVPDDSSFEKFLIMVGDGSNGKSTVLRVCEELLGSANVSHVPLEALNAEFRLADMNNKLANIAPDMNRVDRVQEGLLKALTSGKPIQVNRKNRDPVTMRPTAKLVFATNSLPPIADRSEGIWRRMIAMPFCQRFDESNRDRLRAARLRQELPGIFNWALEGARRLYAQNRFTECAVCQACLGEHRLHSDPFRQFVEEELHLDPVGEIAKSEAYQCYRDYCVRNGHRPKNNSDFGKQMYGLGGVSEGRAGTGTRQRLYRGVRFARPQVAQQPAAPSPPTTRSRSVKRRIPSVAAATAEVQPGRAGNGTMEVRLVWRVRTGEIELTLSA